MTIRSGRAGGPGATVAQSGGLGLFVAAALAAIVLRPWMDAALSGPATQTWITVFVAVVVQAIPFVVLGTALSAGVSLLPPGLLARALPRRPVLAVPLAGLAGAALPGCDCASVPVAGALIRRGVTPAAALAFLLSAPTINPVVLTATAIAFPHDPAMVAARAGAGLAASVAMGLLWWRFGHDGLIRAMPPIHLAGLGPGDAFVAAMRHDLAEAGGYLALGAAAAATLNVAVPRTWLHLVAAHQVVSILGMGLLAVVLSVCSEADAFVAASLTAFSPAARLAFLVVGPMIDMKLFAMQAGTFGHRFAMRFAPATFAVALLAAATVSVACWGIR